MTTMTIPSYVEVDAKRCGYVGNGRGNSLSEVYGSYSSAKAAAWERCERLCSDLDGFNLCITSANSFVFTAQFEFDNPENGRPMVCHITPSRTYAMYLDMRYIEKAHFEWEEYARKESRASYIEQDYISDDGKCRIIWLCHWAYIVIDGEVYRVVNPFRRDGGLRKFIELQRVGAVDDTVINRIIDSHYAVCGSVLPCMVHLGGEHSRCIVYAHLVTDDMPFDRFVGWDAIMLVRCSLADTIAMCVDACMMMHGHDVSGMRVELMD
jgi:hypothetical protein